MIEVIETKIELEAKGEKVSGKTFLLTKIKKYLEEEGYEVTFGDYYKGKEHTLIVVNTFKIES